MLENSFLSMKYNEAQPMVSHYEILNETTVIILAAGTGSRMRSQTPKVLHKVAGLCLLEYALLVPKSLKISDVRVVLNSRISAMPEIEQLSSKYDFCVIIQEKQLGTGDAVRSAIEHSTPKKFILVMYADAPFLKGETVLKLLSNLSRYAVSLLTFNAKDPSGYGRIIARSKQNTELSLSHMFELQNADYTQVTEMEMDIENIVEDCDATERQKQIKLCNGGTIAFTREIALDFIKNNKPSAIGEYYMTNIVSFTSSNGGNAKGLLVDEAEVLGINDKIQLAHAEALMQNTLREFWMMQGVTMIDPASVFLSYDTIFGSDVTIHPNVYIGQNVSIGSNVTIFSFSHIEGAKVDNECFIGPFSRIRPTTRLHTGAKVGNFVEVKNSEIGSITKVMHLAYIGDTLIEDNVNIGAGVVFCNYNGKTKSKCRVGSESFIGSNTSIVAPRDIGKNTTIGAGSVITSDVPDNNLAVGRATQKNLTKTRFQK